MLHFGMMCPEISGHLNPMTTLGRELQGRGHRVTFLCARDAEARVKSAKLGYHPIGETEFPLGAWPAAIEILGKMSGWRGLTFTKNNYRRMAGVMIREAPDAIRKLGIDGLLIDQTYSAGGAIADCVDRPFVSVCNALLLNTEDGLPLPIAPWKPNRDWLSRGRNRLGNFAYEVGTGRMRRVVQRHQNKWGMPVHRTNAQTYSKIAQIGQLPREFDFPRRDLPDTFHYVGPMHETKTRAAVPFDFDRLDGRPLIYASMGTLQNRLGHVFEKIAAACANLDAQLVISLGREEAEIPTRLPGSPIVVTFAPQLELLKRASLVISHAGMNTAMESLTQGVPMLALPITNDQPGVARRIVWTGAGEMVSLWFLRARKLRTLLSKLLEDDSYRENAQRLKLAIERCGAAKTAADIAELAVKTGRPVTQDTLQAAQSLAVETKNAA